MTYRERHQTARDEYYRAIERHPLREHRDLAGRVSRLWAMAELEEAAEVCVRAAGEWRPLNPNVTAVEHAGELAQVCFRQAGHQHSREWAQVVNHASVRDVQRVCENLVERIWADFPAHDLGVA